MEDSGCESICNSLTFSEEKHLLEKNYSLTPFTFDLQKYVYGRRIRFRRIPPHLLTENPVRVVLQYFNEVMRAQISDTDIKIAVRVKPWLDGGQDILVIFYRESVRNRVYNARTVYNGGWFHVCDDLSEERVAIWKILMNRYGETHVITYDGAVCLRRGDEENLPTKYKFTSMSSLKEFLPKMNDVNTDTCVAGSKFIE